MGHFTPRRGGRRVPGGSECLNVDSESAVKDHNRTHPKVALREGDMNYA